MAQILCFLALFVIAGLSEIAKCNSKILNDAGVDSTTPKKPINDNTPEHFEDCYYPHRCNKRKYCDEPLYCDYAVYFGQQKDENKRLLNKYFRKPVDEENSSVVEVKYPRKKSVRNKYPINYIRVENEEKTKQIYDDDVSIVAGGIGKKFVDIKISSNYTVPSKYKIVIYGCEK